MSQLSKAQLATENSTSFPNNTTGYITPALLRDFNTNMIDSNVNQTVYTTDSASFDSRIDSLESFSSSIAIDYINQTELNAATASLSASLTTTINTKVSNTTFNSFSASVTQSITDLQNGKANLNGGNSFTGSQAIYGDITASGDIVAQSDITASGNIKATGISGSGLSIVGNTILGGNAFDSSSINGFVFVTNPQKFRFGTTIFTDYTASVDAEINGLTTTSSFNTFTQSYLIDSASVDSRLDSLEAFSSSLDATFATDAQLAAVSSALNLAKLETSSFNTFSTSVDSRLDSLESFSSSLDATFATDAQLNASSSTLQANIDTKLNTSSFNTFSTSVDSRLDSIEGAGYVTSAITASSVITASFDNGTRNLTFTKGDASQFSVNIPDVSGSGGTTNTGSLLVTASAAGNTITFTKGDASTFDVTVAGGSGSIDTSSFITTGELTGTQYISGALEFTGSARIKIATASFVNTGTGQSQVSIQYNPSASALTYNEVNTNLPQYLNQAIKVGMIATGSLVGGLVKVFANPSETGSAVDGTTTNEGGLLFASQSTTDWRYVFGYNGNPEGDGGKAFVVQRGLHKLAGNATSIPTASLSLYPIGSPIYWSELAQGACTLTRPTNGRVLRLGYIAAIENGANPYVREIWYDPIWEEGETIYLPQISGSVTLTNSNLLTTSSISTLTGSFATTASNTFTGQQTLSDVDLLNQITLDDYSGSLVLFGKGFTSSSMTNITASTSAVDNIIFKTNNNTAATLLSGSANLFVNPAAPTTGFTRLVGTAGNIELNASNVPQISSSMVFPITMNNNYFGGNGSTLAMRGPISASGWTISGNSILGTVNIGSSATLHAERINSLTMTGNQIAGTVTITANSSSLASAFTIANNNINGGFTITAISSSLSANNNNINDSAFTITNNFFSGSLGTGLLAFNRNNIGGQSNQLTIQGGVPAGGAGSPSLSDNTILGGSNTLFVDVANAPLTGSAPYSSAIRNIIGGNSLVVSGSSALAHTQTYGSAFFGRFNANDGIRNKTAQTVFSVGTGTSTTNRKTGFLIDSGSNTFVEGTFNVSGSTSLTGSLTIQSGSSFFANGNKQFNVGAFQSNITQSGSANVSQSMNFETTDISSGVSIASNSRITLENSGTYNIQFSAQIDRVSGSGTDTVHIWLKKNGTNVSASAGAVTISGGAAAAKTIAAWNYVVDAAANDYYELVWEATDSNIQLINQAAGGNIPSTPSIILTVTQVR